MGRCVSCWDLISDCTACGATDPNKLSWNAICGECSEGVLSTDEHGVKYCEIDELVENCTKSSNGVCIVCKPGFTLTTENICLKCSIISDGCSLCIINMKGGGVDNDNSDDYIESRCYMCGEGYGLVYSPLYEQTICKNCHELSPRCKACRTEDSGNLECVEYAPERCEDNCLECDPHTLACTQWPDAYFYDPDLPSTPLPCMLNCLICTSSTVCDACKTGFQYIQGECKSCAGGCARCYYDICDQCAGNLMLWGGICTLGERRCRQIFDGCVQCTYHGCLICIDGYYITSRNECKECGSMHSQPLFTLHRVRMQ